MTDKTSDFHSWFVAQHGPRVYLSSSDTDEHLRQRIHAGLTAGRELKRRVEWDARYESALYAWSAMSRETK